jgi:hypothetical protein
MAKSISDNIKRKRGRPVTTGRGTLVGVRLQPEQLTSLDVWINKQKAPFTRPEAIRAILAAALPVKAK